MRIKPLDRADMSAEQRRVIDHAKATGGVQGGPYNAYIHLPKLFEAQQVLRDATVSEPLTERERKFVHLAVARFWNAGYPWSVQSRGAIEVGIDADTLAAINTRGTPEIADPRERTCYEISIELLTTKGISDKSYAAADVILGVPGLVGLVALIGGFSMTCLTANAFDLDPPAGGPVPLKN